MKASKSTIANVEIDAGGDVLTLAKRPDLLRGARTVDNGSFVFIASGVTFLF
jgi:hypothetical protein